MSGLATRASTPGRAAGDYFALAARAVPGLDGLRGLACLMIFNVHYFAQFAHEEYFTTPGSPAHTALRILHSGSHGVEIFFVISGFLIYGSIQRKRPVLVRFFLERYKRLLPVVLVINIPALYWINAGWKDVADNLFFLQLFPGSTLVTFVTWALVYEMYFYLLCGVWLILLGRGKRGTPWLSFGLIVALYAANSLVFKVHPVLSDWRFVGFFAGMALAMLREDKRTAPLVARVPHGIWPVCTALLFAGCWLWSRDVVGALSARSPALALGYFAAYDVVVAVLAASFLNAGPGQGSIYTWKGLRVVGAVSYSLFLLHTQWGLPLATSLWGGRPESLAGIAPHYVWSLGLSLAMATFLYVHLERFYFRRR